MHLLLLRYRVVHWTTIILMIRTLVLRPVQQTVTVTVKDTVKDMDLGTVLWDQRRAGWTPFQTDQGWPSCPLTVAQHSQTHLQLVQLPLSLKASAVEIP